MTGKKDCLFMEFERELGTPDYHPVSLKQAKSQLKEACLGKRSTGSLTGLHFRLDHLEVYERIKFQTYANKICIDKIKKWNKAKKK